MDACCYNRPMDDQTQDRIRLETEAIFQILKYCERNEWELIGSSVVAYELGKHPDIIKQQEAYRFYDYAKTVYDSDDYPGAASRARQFQAHGVGSIDSLHLAMSECAEADILLTTDDGFINTAKRTDSKIKVMNPMLWLMEVSNDE